MTNLRVGGIRDRTEREREGDTYTDLTRLDTETDKDNNARESGAIVSRIGTFWVFQTEYSLRWGKFVVINCEHWQEGRTDKEKVQSGRMQSRHIKNIRWWCVVEIRIAKREQRVITNRLGSHSIWCTWDWRISLVERGIYPLAHHFYDVLR